MDNQLRPSGFNDPKAAARFTAAMVKWTLGYWLFAFLFLTVRSIALGLPGLLIQALLRIPMILIGIALCAAMFLLLRRIERVAWKARLALIATGVFLATICFSLCAYLVYYVLPHLWVAERGLAFTIANYSVQFVWLFAAWALIYYYVRYQSLAAAHGVDTGFLEELWPRQLVRQVRVPVAEIEWVESEGDYVRVHSGGRSYLIRGTMQRMEAGLDPARFVRIHRRMIVARETVAAVERQSDGRVRARLRDGTALPVGRSYAARLRPPAPSS